MRNATRTEPPSGAGWLRANVFRAVPGREHSAGGRKQDYFEPFRQAERRAELVRAMPRREKDERDSTFSTIRGQSRTQFGLCRGEKRTVENELKNRETYE